MYRWLVPLVLMSGVCHARVFNWTDSNFAPYVRGSAGYMNLDQDAFANSSGEGTTMAGKSNYDYGGEIGFMFGLSPKLHVRLGAEVLDAHPVNTTGMNSSGTSLFTLNSSVFVFNPNLTIEYVFKASGNVRFFAELGAGYATIQGTNVYSMTSAGTAAYGVPNYTESMTTTTISGQAGAAMEALFTDRVTFILDLGYRYLPVDSLKYSSAVNSIVTPSGATKGSPVLNEDGSQRRFNLSGPYGGAAFRFYLNFL